jgi:hypothetical protein
MGNVEVRPMISDAYKLTDGLRALQRAAEKDVMKMLLHV